MAVEPVNSSVDPLKGGKQEQTQKQDQTQGQAQGIISMSSKLINFNNIDQKVAKLAQSMVEVLKEAGRTDASINIFSNIITVSRYTGGEVSYYLIVPGTAGTELTVNQFIDSVMAKQRPMLSVDLVTPEMHKYIQEELVRVYKQAKKDVKSIIALDGLVLPSNIDTADENFVKALVSYSYNACVVEEMVKTGEHVREIHTMIQTASRQGTLKLKQYVLTEDTLDDFGKPTRTEFGIEMISPSVQGFMSQLSQEEVVVSTKGYINVLPKSYEVQYPGMMPIQKTGFVPNIVINMIEQPLPTMAHAFIGIASTAVMARDYNWVKPLLSNADGIGYLNKIVNINGDKNGGKVIDIAKLKMTPDEKANLIIKIIDQAPTLSVDIPILDTKITTLTPVLIAATAANQSTVNAAEMDIIKTLDDVTKGEFSKRFKGRIFDNRGIFLPQGEFASDKAMKSVDDIDSQFIVKNYANNYIELLSEYMYSELGFNGDSYFERVKFLQKIGVDAKLTGKKVRVTFSAEFINAMLESFMAIGLSPQFDSVNVINKQTGLGFTANYFQHAGLQNLPQFGMPSQVGGQGFGYQSQFQSGYYR